MEPENAAEQKKKILKEREFFRILREKENAEFLAYMRNLYPNLKPGRQRPRSPDEKRILDSWATTNEELQKIQARPEVKF